MLSKLPSACPTEVLDICIKHFFEGKLCFPSFWDIQRTVFVFWQKILVWSSKLHSACPEQTFLKTSSRKIYILFSFLDIEKQSCGIFDKILLVVLCLSVFSGTFWKRFLLKKIVNFISLGLLSKKFRAFRRKIFGGFVRTTFNVSSATSWEKNFSENLLFPQHFRISSKKRSASWQFFPAGLSKLDSKCPKAHAVDEKKKPFLLQKELYHLFLDTGRNVFGTIDTKLWVG